MKTGGRHAGHNGLRSIHAHIGEAYHRVRLGIGHPGRKDLVAAYVLHDFHKADEDWLDDLLRGISDGAGELARGETGKFQNAVALRVNPPRSSGGKQDKAPASPDAAPGKGTPKSGAAAAPTPERPAEAEAERDDRSPLQKLADKFR